MGAYYHTPSYYFYLFSLFLLIFKFWIQYFKGNTNCLIYCSAAPCFSIKELASILICTDETTVCTEWPITCQANTSFILDTSTLTERGDFKADNNGSIMETCLHSGWFKTYLLEIQMTEIKPQGRTKKNPHPFFSTALGTCAKISEKASSSLRPTSIYDELYQEVGDIKSRKGCSQMTKWCHYVLPQSESRRGRWFVPPTIPK